MIDLRVDQQFGLIGVKTVPYQFSLKIQPAQLELSQTSSRIEMNTTPLDIQIDYSSARESIGYRGIAAQMRAMVSEGSQAVGEGIDRRVREGLALGEIEKHISLEQVVAQALEPQFRDLELEPVDPISIHVVLGRLSLQTQPAKREGNFTPGGMQTDFHYGQIHTYIEREPYIRLKAVGSVLDREG